MKNKWTPHLSLPLTVAFTVSIILSTNGGECVVVQSLLFLQAGFLFYFTISEPGVSFSLLLCSSKHRKPNGFEEIAESKEVLYFSSSSPRFAFIFVPFLSGYLSLSKRVSGCYRA